jgi:hypothetical protein
MDMLFIVKIILSVVIYIFINYRIVDETFCFA